MRIADLQKRTDLTLVTDPEDVQQIKDTIGDQCEECDAFFVRAIDGEYVDVFGFQGTTPNITKQVHAHIDNGEQERY